MTTIDGRITGIEALLRWDHPTKGVVSPTTIVALAERSALISGIGRWVLERACHDRGLWQAAHGCDDLQICVNVSAHQLMAAGFAETVAAVLVDSGTEPRQLTLEMTESVFIEDLERAIVVFEDLKHMGVTLALDDFGTGYSSLSHLQQFPIDIVKIDQTFISVIHQQRPCLYHNARILHTRHLDTPGWAEQEDGNLGDGTIWRPLLRRT